jgi:HSP20 family protein
MTGSASPGRGKGRTVAAPWLGPGWDPSGDLAALQQEMQRLFETLLGLGPGRSQPAETVWAPPMDVCESPAAVRVLIELPGLKQEQIGIEVIEGTLRIRGERPPDPRFAKEQLLRLERRSGPFLRTLTLPASVDADQIRASYRDGLLEIRLPKRSDAVPRVIAVETR